MLTLTAERAVERILRIAPGRLAHNGPIRIFTSTLALAYFTLQCQNQPLHVKKMVTKLHFSPLFLLGVIKILTQFKRYQYFVIPEKPSFQVSAGP